MSGCGDDVEVGIVVGADVMVGVLVGWSQHPQRKPGVRQVEDAGVEPVAVVVTAAVVVIVGSLHTKPNHPGSWQLVEVAAGLVGICVGAGVAVGMVVVGSLHPNQPGVSHVDVVVVDNEDVAALVVVGSLHPNQPGVLHVEVEVAVVEVVVVVEVVSSRQPHQPGVWQVAVRVNVGEVVVAVVVVVISEPLLRKNFQSTQS